MDIHIFDYYLSLLQVQMAILGFVVAGLVTMMQMLTTAVPKRQVKMLAKPLELVTYIVFLSVLLGVLAIATWATSFAHETSYLIAVFTDHVVSIMLLVFCLLSLAWFVVLIYRAKRLLNPQLYMEQYLRSTRPQNVIAYVRDIYETTDAKSDSESVELKNKKLYDPFQPIREYIKHNSQQQYDYGTAAGLKLFSKLFDKTFPVATGKEQAYLAEYITASMVEFFRVFEKAASEKRKLDVIRLIHGKGRMFLAGGNDQCLLIIIRGLEEIGKVSCDEDEIVLVIESIKDLTDSYLDQHKHVAWKEIADTFEEICLSVTRLAETYYLQSDNPLRSVPLISYYTGKMKSVSISLVNFFVEYKDLADLRTEAHPKLYFEAIESLIEILYMRIREIEDSGKSAIGLNGHYSKLTARLYTIYHRFALEAIEHKRPDLFGLSMGNLRRIIKSANRFKLEEERYAVTGQIIELSARALHELGDVKVKGDRTVAVYAKETLEKHADKLEIERLFNELHDKPVNEALRSRIL